MLSTILLGMIGTTEIIVIAVVVLLLFGGKKIPELMKGLGKGISEFKKAKDDIASEVAKETQELSKGKKGLEIKV